MGVWDASLGAYGVIGVGAYSTATRATYANYTGDDYGTVQNWSNGLNWYRTSSYGSWGFTSAAETALNTADLNLQNGITTHTDAVGTPETTAGKGLSFHVDNNGNLSSGWAYNATGNNFTSINTTANQRVFWKVSAPQAVPEPASLALMGLVLGGLCLSRRRAA